MCKRKQSIFFSFFIFLGVLSCEVTTTEDVDIKTRQFLTTSDNYVQFYTNDKQYCNYIFWDYFDADNTTDMTSFQGSMIKKSGAKGSAYGFIFCVQDTNNFYMLLISNYGDFIIMKKVDGSYETLRDWTDSSLLNAGAGQINTVKVVKSGSDTFSIYFNDSSSAVKSFTDTSFDNGGYGFFVAVGSSDDEDFPDKAVNVKFRLTSPLEIPEMTQTTSISKTSSAFPGTIPVLSGE